MGGLTVMRALVERLPHESFVYLGDTARLPYGSKSADTVRRYAVQCASALMRHRIKLLVVACNTASATALPALTEALKPIPVLGVIEPGADAAVKAAPSGRIAVIATEGTVNGGAYERAIHARNPAAVVTQQACPLFVALAEEGLTHGPIVELAAKRYLDPLLTGAPPDCLVLGCTHFPVLKETIAHIAGPRVKLVDSAEQPPLPHSVCSPSEGLRAPAVQEPSASSRPMRRNASPAWARSSSAPKLPGDACRTGRSGRQ